jgi:SSS family solute:Na+ symporter
VMEFMSNNNSVVVSEGSVLAYFLDINFLHFALFLFLFCSALLMIVSKLSTPQPEASLELVTFQKGARVASFKWTTDVVLTIVLVILVLILWAVFSPFGVG